MSSNPNPMARNGEYDGDITGGEQKMKDELGTTNFQLIDQTTHQLREKRAEVQKSYSKYVDLLERMDDVQRKQEFLTSSLTKKTQIHKEDLLKGPKNEKEESNRLFRPGRNNPTHKALSTEIKEQSDFAIQALFADEIQAKYSDELKNHLNDKQKVFGLRSSVKMLFERSNHLIAVIHLDTRCENIKEIDIGADDGQGGFAGNGNGVDAYGGDEKEGLMETQKITKKTVAKSIQVLVALDHTVIDLIKIACHFWCRPDPENFLLATEMGTTLSIGTNVFGFWGDQKITNQKINFYLMYKWRYAPEVDPAQINAIKNENENSGQARGKQKNVDYEHDAIVVRDEKEDFALNYKEFFDKYKKFGGYITQDLGSEEHNFGENNRKPTDYYMMDGDTYGPFNIKGPLILLILLFMSVLMGLELWMHHSPAIRFHWRDN